MNTAEPIAFETTTVTHKNRSWEIFATMSSGGSPNTRANLLNSGWDGETYVAKSKKGSVAIFYRSTKSGEFSFVLQMPGLLEVSA